MPSLDDLRKRISSVKSTQKITKAMKMVAAAKLRKAQEMAEKGRPYSDKMDLIIQNLSKAINDPSNAPKLLVGTGEDKTHLCVVMTADRGLCGGLNNNLFKKVLDQVEIDKTNSIDSAFSLIGNKSTSFFQRVGGDVIAKTSQLGDKPKIEQVLGLIKSTIDKFLSKEIDELYVVYNRFVNTVSQEPVVQKILPISVMEKNDDYNFYWDYLYEPDAKDVLESLFTRYLESLIYRAIVENLACEQASRMVAMKAASDNASDLISELQLIYNKNRQAAITQEISEIISGAAAL